MSDEKDKVDDTVQEEESKAEAFETKDAPTIHALNAIGHTPAKITPTAAGNQLVLFYGFPETAWTDYDAYNRGEDFTISLRAYEASVRQFKTNLHRFAIDFKR